VTPKLPELAGIFSAAVGTMYVLGITLLFAFPVGVMSAVYLEEFAPDNKLTQTIEVNINNLAAVPSIIFGLLGLALFINFFGVPRSSALAGGLTLGLMTLPIIIISTPRRCARCLTRSAWAPLPWAAPAGRWYGTMCCRPRCLASSPAQSSDWPRPWVKRHR